MSERDESMMCEIEECREPATLFYKTNIETRQRCASHKFQRDEWTERQRSAVEPITREEFIAFQVMHS